MNKIAMGLVGLGGYGGYVCEQLLSFREKGTGSLVLTDACDPEIEKFPERVAHLKAAGVRVHHTLAELLASDVEAVWLPVPIDLHRRFTEESLAAGKAVLCEKPAAGCVQDVDAMIRARDAAPAGAGLVAIAYQDMYAESTWVLKRRLVGSGKEDGEIGRITGATLWAAWPRAEEYFARPWAGKLARDGVWILDSPANNAMAHFVHLTLFLLGPTVLESARPTVIAAELYRANPIENYDTCCMRVTVEGGATFLLTLTHAARRMCDPVIELTGTRGRMRYSHAERIAQFTSADGRRGGKGRAATVPLLPDPHLAVPEAFATFVRWGGEKSAGHLVPHGSLEMARSHAVVISAASEAAPVMTLRRDVVQEEPPPAAGSLEAGGRGWAGGGILRYIPGIEELMEAAMARGQMLHETGLAGWTVPARPLNVRGYAEFKGVASDAPTAAK